MHMVARESKTDEEGVLATSFETIGSRSNRSARDQRLDAAAVRITSLTAMGVTGFSCFPPRTIAPPK